MALWSERINVDAIIYSRGWQTLPVKSQMVNISILGFSSHIVFVVAIQQCDSITKTDLNNTQVGEAVSNNALITK